MQKLHSCNSFSQLIINYENEHQSLRRENKLINAIDHCPGIVKIGNTIVKTRNKNVVQPYLNKTRIRSLVQTTITKSNIKSS
jgi:hypothetical protein